ncbi:MAG TPA: OB-fold domain-containing protein [Azospirillum sp.]|nr:OB-fold domain-containing protein [Azospirillum sp.]
MAASGSITIFRCAACGALDPTPRGVCRACLSDRLERVAVAGTGALAAATLIRRPPKGMDADGPYAVAVVDLDAGVRVVGRLAHPEAGLAPGSRVALHGWQVAIPVFDAC